MQELDLKRHEPAEFTGKMLALGGVEYRLGPVFRAGDQGYMHPLHNVRSGLALHLVQVRRTYLTDPGAAAAASRVKARATAELRAGFFRDGKPCPTAPIRAFEAAGGVVELHEYPGGVGDASARLLAEAAELAENGQVSSAIASLEDFLATHPDHTEALSLAAACHVKADQYGPALGKLARATSIEPNLSRYILQSARCYLEAGQVFAASVVLGEFQRGFPGEPDAGLLAVHTALGRGKPHEARSALSEAAAPPHVLAQLRPLVDQASQASAVVAALSAQRGAGLPLPDDAIEQLRGAYDLFSLDPAVNANLAFQLRDRGDFARAADLLQRAGGAVDGRWTPYCRVNAAFCFAAMQEWHRAEAHASSALQILGYPSADISPADVPGVVTWIDFDRGWAMEQTAGHALMRVDTWLRDSARDGKPSAAAQALRPLYQKAAAMQEATEGSVPNASAERPS